MTAARWSAEIRKMKQAFPWFRPVDLDNRVGFVGELYGPTGEIHSVQIIAWKRGYPATPPLIFIDPPVGSNWCADGSLCVQRKWDPTCTFAQQALYAIAYLNDQAQSREFDTRPGQ